LKIVLGHNTAADCPVSVKFYVRKQFFTEFGTDTLGPQNVFLVFLMQFGLPRAGRGGASRIVSDALVIFILMS